MRPKTLKNIPVMRNFLPKQQELLKSAEMAENNTETTPKRFLFRKFKVKKSNFGKKSSSLSPVNKQIENNRINDEKFDFSKLKKVKETSQESEVKLQHLYNQIKECSEFETAKKVRLCFEMINSVFMYYFFYFEKYF